MTQKCRMPNAESGTNAAASACAHREQPASSHQHPAPRRGLTLIELLVTIVIMVTVLAGVLPLVSPNNNSRKLREASRQLNSLLAQAQAQAARDGRPVGVEFRESGTSAPFSGMAVEAYLTAEPAPFAGFSEFSRVAVLEHPEKLQYGKNATGNGNGGVMFEPRLTNFTVWRLEFSLYGQPDPIPPRTIRNGDTLDINGNRFLVVDDDGSAEGFHQIDQATGYLQSTHLLNVVWLNNQGQLPPRGLKPYSFARQPTKTSEQPLQFPRGIGIDMEASGATGLGNSIDFDSGGATTVKVMFSPSGSIGAVYRDNVRLDGVEQLYLLVGLFENGNNSNTFSEGYDFIGFPVADQAELTSRRGQINWLSGDSRWVSVNRAGRIITAENNVSFDPSSSDFLDPIRSAQNVVRAQRDRQLEFARNFASQMSGSTGK